MGQEAGQSQSDQEGGRRLSLKHDELAEDLARAIGLMPFLDVPLGSVFLSARGTGPSRADVVAVKPSYNRFCISIYEVKVSRSDFLSDIRSEKWRGYLPHCNRFYFAVESGVCQKNEIPAPAGLMVRGTKGWSTVRGATPQDTEIPVETLKALIFAKTRIPARLQRQQEINHLLSSYRHHRNDDQSRRKLFGARISKVIATWEDFEQSRRLLKYKIDDLEEIQEIIKDIGQLIAPGERLEYLFQLEKRVEKLKAEAEETMESADKGA